MFRLASHIGIWVTFTAGFAASAEVEVKGRRFTLPDGFELQLAASQPLVDRPITAAFDEQGRLYVADSSGSNDKVEVQLQERPHRIVRLEDSDGDGLFDKSQVYADRMMFPEGTMWFDGSLYVAAPPSIWRLTDTNDDGVADQREEWFQGKTLTGCANDLHGPYLGPDGWIYWCKGAFASQSYERPGGQIWETRAAHIFRRHPDGGLVEPVMSGGMDNPVDVVFTPGGERIFTTTFLQHPRGGKRDGLIHALYGGLYGKVHSVIEGHPRTGELLPPIVHLGAAAPCGLVRMESDELGAEYQHNLFAALFNMQKVTRHVLGKSGATFASQDTDFLVTEDMDFHPTDLVEDADGSLLVIDTGGWYKLCCPTSQLHKPDVLGGIYRIRRRGAHRIPDPRGTAVKWSSIGVGELANLLGDSRPAVRRRAQALLAKRGTGAVAELTQVLRQGSGAARLAAVWTLCRIDDADARKSLSLALADHDPDVVQAAVHSLSVHRDEASLPQLLDLLRSAEPHVKRSAAEALGRIGNAQAIPHLLREATGCESDRALEHSLTYALIEINDLEATRKMLADPTNAIKRMALIAADQMASGSITVHEIEPLLDCSDQRLRQAAWWLVGRHPEWAAGLASYFERLVEGPATPDTLSRIRQKLPALLTNRELRRALDGAFHLEAVAPETRLALVEAVGKSSLRAWPVDWSSALIGLLAEDDPAVIVAVITTLHGLEDSELAENCTSAVVRVAQRTDLAEQTQLQALFIAVRAGVQLDLDMVKTICGYVASDQSPASRALAVDLLLESPLSEPALAALIEAIPGAGSMELARLLTAFRQASGEATGIALIEALHRCPAATSLTSEQLTTSLERFPAAVRQRTERLIAWIDEANLDKMAQMEQVFALMDHADIRRGQAIFNSSKASCRACHEMGYLGGNVGPDLTRIGSIRSERDLLEAILYPNISFVRSYEPVDILTTSGKVFSGLVRDETAEEVLLALDAQKTVRIRHSDVEMRRPGKVSVMPAGLEKQMSSQDLADLVKFLHSAR